MAGQQGTQSGGLRSLFLKAQSAEQPAAAAAAACPPLSERQPLAATQEQHRHQRKRPLPEADDAQLEVRPSAASWPGAPGRRRPPAPASQAPGQQQLGQAAMPHNAPAPPPWYSQNAGQGPREQGAPPLAQHPPAAQAQHPAGTQRQGQQEQQGRRSMPQWQQQQERRSGTQAQPSASFQPRSGGSQRPEAAAAMPGPAGWAGTQAAAANAQGQRQQQMQAHAQPPRFQEQPQQQQFHPQHSQRPQAGAQPAPQQAAAQQHPVILPQLQQQAAGAAWQAMPAQQGVAPPPPFQQEQPWAGAGPGRPAGMPHLPPQPHLPQPAGKQPLRQKLYEWGLPPGVVKEYEARGVKSMYPWQAAALECGEQFNNLVYCAPTSGGKSLVAEVLMIRRLMLSLRHIPQPRRSKPKYGRVLVVLPYASIVSEKAEHLAAVLAPMHASVKGFCGAEEKGQALAPRGETVACCTIEKANVAINRLAQDKRLGELCCVVVDELHMVGDAERGVGLEMSLTKLLFSPDAQHVQIIGMSATMGGLEALRAWLRAELFLTNFRPVPLSEHAVFRGKVYEKLPKEALTGDSQGQPPLRELREVAPSDPRRDADRLVPLVAEVTSEGHSVLVFCSTRKACESAAALIADLLPQISPAPDAARQAELSAQRASILSDVKIAMGGAMSSELEACMLQGVAWHHAGLTAEERAGVERAYRAGAVSVITATSTLAAGVNLPARRVILRSLHQGIGPVSRSQYLQMVGRAGRAGHSAVGESFIIGKGAANGQEWGQICALVTAPIPCLKSSVLSLEAASSTGAKDKTADAAAGAGEVTLRGTLHLQQLLLEGIANGSVREPNDVARLVCSTFAAQQQGRPMMQQASKAALRTLISEKKLVQFRDGQIDLTDKGRAVYDSALPLDPAMALYDNCRAADDGFMLDTPIVLLYHCLLSHPFQIASWFEWGRTLQALGAQEQRIAESVGVLAIHAHAAQSGRPPGAETQERHARLAAALALCELTQEKDVMSVVAKWGREGFVSKGLTRGQVQKLQQDVGKWMGMASLLCESAGWWPLATLYSNLSQMAAAGVRQDLLPLMRIPDMDASKARALFKAGLRDAQALATADEQTVARALAPAIASQMRRRPTGGKPSGAGATATAAAGSYAAAGMAQRAAGTLVKSARDHLRKQMAEIASLASEIAEDEQAAALAGAAAGTQPGQQQGQPAQQQAGGQAGAHPQAQAAGAHEQLPPEEVERIQREVAELEPAAAGSPGSASQPVAAVPASAWAQGTVKVTELRPRTSGGQLEDFFSLWGAQPRYALAVHCLSAEDFAAAAAAAVHLPPLAAPGKPGRRPSSAGAAAAAAQRLQGIAVCWDPRQAYFLELSAAHAARPLRQGSPTTVLDAVRAVLAQATHKVCYGAADALPELLLRGVRLGGHLEDPRLAGALLWSAAAEEDPAQLELKRVQAAVAPAFKVRVPNLCRSGVTATCRTAVLALACMGPMKQLLAHKGMLEAFLHLECPAALALLHINASPAAPRLLAPALAATHEQALASAAVAREQLRRIYNMPALDASSLDTQMQLLGSLRLPLPEVDRRRRKPALPLEHLQGLLQRCRPHQQRERDVLSALVQHKAVTERLLAPLDVLLGLQASPPAGTGQQQGQQQAGAAPGAAAGGAMPPRPSSASLAAAAAAAEPGACHVRQDGSSVCLQLAVNAATGRLTYGSLLDRQLSALLASEWCPFLAAGCEATVQEELARGSLTPDAVAAAAFGTPVVLRMPRRQLRAAMGSPGRGQAAPSGGGHGQEGPGGGDGAEEEEEDEGQAPDVWMVGSLLAVLGKQLRAALDFGGDARQHSQRQQPTPPFGEGSQRVSMASVRVALPPDSNSRLGAAGGSGSLSAAPRTVELHWPCTQLWRLGGASAGVLGGSGGGGIVASTSRQRQQGAAACEVGRAAEQPLHHAITWGLNGYCSGAAAFAVGALEEGSAAAAAEGELRHKGGQAEAPQHREAQQQRQEQQDGQRQQAEQQLGASPAGASVGGGGLLLRVDLLFAELAVLAQLSGQPELLAALAGSSSDSCRTPAADAYQRVSHCWAAAAGRLDVPGTGGGGMGQPPVLIAAEAAAAAVGCLVHGWSTKKLGWVLRCSKQAAGEVLESFLAAFPRLKTWLAEAAAAGEATCAAATLAGRQRQFAALKRPDDAMARGKLHKSILLHVLEGSLADLTKAALVAAHASLSAPQPAAGGAAGGELGAGGRAGAAGTSHHQQQHAPQQQEAAREGPAIVLALGQTLVVRLPPAFVASHGGSQLAAAGAAAGAVQRGLQSLAVGRAQLSAPLLVAFSAGRSLHPLELQPVAALPG